MGPMNHFTTHRPLLMSTRWMVTADHPLAVQAGAGVLDRGGNAVDAAVAANLVMTTVRPHMCGLGGDLFMLIYKRSGQKLEVLNASGRAPASATREAYRQRGYEDVPETGILAVTVPGAIAGWQAALERHGTLGLDTLLARALPYARDGFPVGPAPGAAAPGRILPGAHGRRPGRFLPRRTGGGPCGVFRCRRGVPGRR